METLVRHFEIFEFWQNTGFIVHVLNSHEVQHN